MSFIMKKFLGTILFALLLSGNTHAETLEEKRDHYIYNNLSSEYTECMHYYLIASEAIKTNDPDSKMIKNSINSSNLASKLAFMYGEEAGMTVDGMVARSKLYADDMLKSLDNNYANISVLLIKYGDQCKGMIENPEVRNQYWINKAYEKYK